MPKKKWTRRAIVNEAAKYKNRTEMNRRSRVAYEAARDANLLAMLFDEQKEERIKYVKWTEKSIRKAAKPFKSKSEMVKRNPNAYQAAWRKKMLNDLFDNMCQPWTEEKVRQKAAQYKKRYNFRRYARTAFNAAKRLGILDEIHPVTGRQPKDGTSQPVILHTKASEVFNEHDTSRLNT